MRILFIHHSFPGSFRYLAAALAADQENEVVFLSEWSRREVQITGVRRLTVPGGRSTPTTQDRNEREMAQILGYGTRFANTLLKVRQQGFVPDVVYADPGRGCSFFVQDIFPEAFYAVHAEWYYRKGENYTFFTRGKPRPAVDFAPSRIRNMCQLNALSECDLAVTSSYWQREQYPSAVARNMHVIHEGVDTDFFSPRDQKFRVDGCDLSHVSELVTFSGRGLEPFRGFPQFYRSIPYIQEARPECHVLIMASLPQQGSEGGRGAEAELLENLRREVPVDSRRVHFVGFRPYEEYRMLLRASSVHVYFTAPFALSSGLFEAMSCGCLLVSSDTAPVREVVRHGENGFLCDFWDSRKLGEAVVELLGRSRLMAPLRDAARGTILKEYNLRTELPRHVKLLQDSFASWQTGKRSAERGKV